MNGVLPKPARVEKWQRWRDSRGVMFTALEDTGNGDKWMLRKDGDNGHWFGNDMIARDGWTFLGYTKPDKVEVGQRWRNQGKVYVVEAMSADVANMGGVSRASIQAMLAADTFEYLGMAESASCDWRTATGEALDREANRNGFARAIGDTDEKLRARFAAPGDHKAEARRANEEAAKRLIANPPDWAYPKAWMCAVLWCMEQRGDRSALLDSLDEGAAWMFIGLYQRLRGEGMTHESALDKATKREVPIVKDIVNAYARGMERTSPMTRQGVKGGISTCDLGGDYE